MATSNRIKYIDIARGIAIICIVLGHLGIDSINKIVFTFHVPIFFFITGYFINNKLSIDDFISNKVKTLIVPYVCTCTVIILLGTLKSGVFQGAEVAKETAGKWIYASFYGAGDTYFRPFYIKAIGAIWFLLATFWGSIFLRSTLNMKKRNRIAVILVLFVIGYWSRELCWFPFSIQAGCCATLFMYIGYLFQDIKKAVQELSTETKIGISILALTVWLSFIKNFQSFWLVHCDIGRGVIDIVGCICGCYIIMLISSFIEKHTRHISNVLAFVGKYSLFVLCIHIVELNLIPWGTITRNLIAQGMPVDFGIYFIILAKFTIIMSLTVIFAKWNFTRRLFGFSKIEKTKLLNK